MSENKKKLSEEKSAGKQEKIETNGENIEQQAGNGTELEEDIEKLQAAEGRRGSNASHGNGCCMGPASRWKQSWQRSKWQSSNANRVYGVQYQLAPVTPVHVLQGQSGTEQSHEEGAGGERTVNMGRQCRRNEGFPTGSVVDATLLPK